MSLKDLSQPVLYSTMSTLAYNINRSFYGGVHYLWCTPYFGSNYDLPEFSVPPSSSPLEIYRLMEREIDGADLHATKLKLNRVGIKRGADKMFSLDRISEDTRMEIQAICDLATPNQFRPLLCVIPRLEAVPFFQKVDVKDRANPLSHEYILRDLPRASFDIIRMT